MGFKVESDFIYKDLRCVVIFTEMGHRCGYVGVTEESPFYKKDYDGLDLSVHGGLTYSEGGKDSKYPVESDLWWLGFDCAHYMDGADVDLAYELGLTTKERYDTRKKIDSMYPTGGTIRSLNFCEEECKCLVAQILEAGKQL